MAESAPAIVPSSSPWRSRGIALLKWGLFLLTIGFVGRYAYLQRESFDLSQLDVQPGWLVVACGLYFLSWVPAALVWRHLLQLAGARVPVGTAIRAHFCGHLGKYVPGKAFSLVIRAAMVHSSGVSVKSAGLWATVETLLTMACGLLLFALGLPLVWNQGNQTELLRVAPVLQHVAELSREWQWALSAMVLLVAIVLTPLFVWGLNRVRRQATRLGGAETSADEAPVASRPLQNRTVWGCSLGLAVGWGIGGITLGAVLASLGIYPDSALAWVWWTTTVTAATAVGFLVLFAPAGLGVREAILFGLLQLSPAVGPAEAMAAALLLRIVSFLSELGFSALLYVLPQLVPAAHTGDS